MSRWQSSIAAALVALSAWGVGGTAQAAPVAVSLELALVIDVSNSVDGSEYLLQRNGYRDAFKSATVGSAIESFAASGGIAVGVYYFSANVLQMVQWTQLTTAAQASTFGDQIGGIVRPAASTDALGGGQLGVRTNIAEGIDRAVEGIAGNNFEGTRRVIDVSGDGRQNYGRDGSSVTGCTGTSNGTEQACIDQVNAARDDAALAGIVINGLAITDDIATLDTYYTDEVKTGANSFVLEATFATFATAVQTKIGREVTGDVPEPSSLALAGLALLGLGLARRRATA